LQAVLRHLDLLENKFGPESWGTIYIGGGTPSVLPPLTLRALLDRLTQGNHGNAQRPDELTVEINPEDTSLELLGLLQDCGASRLSIGIQSLEQEARRNVARRGDAFTVKKNLELITGFWKGRLSVDMMYGLPGQTIEGLCNDVRFVADLGIGHVSLYELTLENGTPLWNSVQESLVDVPDEDFRADQYEASRVVLEKAGYERYEVSNWAKPDQECKHNGVYWTMGDWLALGPSGVSNVSMPDGSFLRIENTRNNNEYYQDPVASSVEIKIDGLDAEFECLMTSLRTRTGFDTARFETRFGFDAHIVFGNLPFMFPDLVHGDTMWWRATDRGMDMLNSVLVYCLEQAEKFHTGRTIKKGEKFR